MKEQSLIWKTQMAGLEKMCTSMKVSKIFCRYICVFMHKKGVNVPPNYTKLSWEGAIQLPKFFHPCPNGCSK